MQDKNTAGAATIFTKKNIGYTKYEGSPCRFSDLRNCTTGITSSYNEVSDVVTANSKYIIVILITEIG